MTDVGGTVTAAEEPAMNRRTMIVEQEVNPEWQPVD
jgi:hypothetical protein